MACGNLNVPDPLVIALLDRPLYMSTKNTILKAYDGRFLQIFQAGPNALAASTAICAQLHA